MEQTFFTKKPSGNIAGNIAANNVETATVYLLTSYKKVEDIPPYVYWAPASERGFRKMSKFDV